MIRNLSLFLATFVVGALLALVVRAALFAPHAGADGHPAGGGDYAPLVSNALVPAAPAAAPAATPPAAPAPHAHAPAAAAAPSSAATPVNTVCAICGMDVDPDLPTATYQGQTIGFGCRMCPPKFKRDPDKYGPAYLRNEIIKS